MSDYNLVYAADMKRIIASEAAIIDVRRKDEHDAQRLIAPHALVTLDVLNPQDYMLRHGLDKDAPVYILCRSGKRARAAADMFAAAGYKNTYVIEGGILACAEGGVPVEGASSGGACAMSSKTPGCA